MTDEPTTITEPDWENQISIRLNLRIRLLNHCWNTPAWSVI